MILVACVVLLMASFLFVFYSPRKPEEQHQKTRLEFLRESKDVVYENLRDLNFEYSAGKHPEEDYLAQRALLEAEAAEILAEMDVLERIERGEFASSDFQS